MGGMVFGTEGDDLKLEDIQMQDFGKVGEVVVTKDDCMMLKGQGGESAISKRVEMIRDQIEDTSSEYEKEKLQERMARLASGVALLKIGGSSEVEVSEKKDRVVDALNATRAAVEEGIVPGGGKALLHCSTKLEAVKENSAKNMDQKIGVDIVMKALRAPLNTIASNAGEEGAVIVGELIKEGTPVEQGFDAQNGVFTDMIAAGIIDPTKVTRTGIVDAASV